MSLDAQDWVWEHSASKGTARLVLLAIADKASGAECSAYAGTTFLMRRANASRSAVIQSVDKLIADKDLEIIEGRKGPKGETCYRLPHAKGYRRKGGPDSVPVQNLDRSGNQTPGGPESVPGGSGIETPRGPESGPQNTRNAGTPEGTHKEDRDGSQAGEERDYQWPRFGDFWVCYPRSKQIEKTKQAWRDALDRGADPDLIVKAATAYAFERRGKDPTYTPYSATWLNDGRYEDQPDPEAGGYEPYRNPTDQSVYDEDL